MKAIQSLGILLAIFLASIGVAMADSSGASGFVYATGNYVYGNLLAQSGSSSLAFDPSGQSVTTGQAQGIVQGGFSGYGVGIVSGGVDTFSNSATSGPVAQTVAGVDLNISANVLYGGTYSFGDGAINALAMNTNAVAQINGGTNGAQFNYGWFPATSVSGTVVGGVLVH
jgi:hypothetical protein